MILFSVALIFMNQPSTGTIIKPTLEDEVQVESSKTNTITAKYFSLTYDAGLDTVSDISSTDKTAYEVYRVARSDITGRRTFVITVKTVPGGMSEESSYKFRHIHPETYRQSSETFGDLSFVLFEKLDGSEMTGFVSHGDYYAMLAYTLDAPGGNLYDEAKELFQRFRWNN